MGRIEFQDGNARGRVVADGHPVIGQEEDVVLEPLDGRLGLTDSQTGELDGLVLHHGHRSRLFAEERDVSFPFDFQNGVGFGVGFVADAQQY